MEAGESNSPGRGGSSGLLPIDWMQSRDRSVESDFEVVSDSPSKHVSERIARKMRTRKAV